MVRMLDAGPVDDQTRGACVRNLKLVQRESERCTAIVRNLLEFARQRPLALKDVECGAVLEEAVSLVQHQAMLQGLTIAKQVGPLRDPGRFRAVAAGFRQRHPQRLRSDVVGGTVTIQGHATSDGFVELSFRDTDRAYRRTSWPAFSTRSSPPKTKARARVVRGVRHCRTARRHHHSAERCGPRHDLHHPAPVGSRGRPDSQAS